MGETPAERAKRIADEERHRRDREQDLVDMGSENLLNAILEERNRQEQERQRRDQERADRDRKKTRAEKREERRERRRNR